MSNTTRSIRARIFSSRCYQVTYVGSLERGKTTPNRIFTVAVSQFIEADISNQAIIHFDANYRKKVEGYLKMNPTEGQTDT